MSETPSLDRFAAESRLSDAITNVCVDLLAITRGDIAKAAKALRSMADAVERNGERLLPAAAARREQAGKSPGG